MRGLEREHTGGVLVIGRLVAVVVLVLAVGQPMPNADLEREARAIDEMLIAPCCFTQQVSVHQSEAAAEVRRDVRARLAAGQTRQQILDAYVGQYGKRILAEPPASGFDLTLYVMPFVLFLASVGLVVAMVRRFTRHPPAATAGGVSDAATVATSPEENVRLDDELRDLD